MRVSRLTIRNFRGIAHAELLFAGHTLFVGGNNVGKSTVCEALDLVLGPDRMKRRPVAQEFDFYNGIYTTDGGHPPQICVEVVLTALSPEVQRLCRAHLEHWNNGTQQLIPEGGLEEIDNDHVEPCLRLKAVVAYDPDDDDFGGNTYFAHPVAPDDDGSTVVRERVKRAIGFLYLRALRTGSRALSLERGTLLDLVLRMKNVSPGLWESTRTRLKDLDPAVDAGDSPLGPVLAELEERIAQYIPMQGQERATRFYVSQLTREHLRRTLAFFLSMSDEQQPVPFQQVGAGTLNTLVLALLTVIADLKGNDVMFAMEEPEIAVPPHTQRRIARYLREKTSQCFVTTHSPYVIECFEPEQIRVLRRGADGVLDARSVRIPAGMKAKLYRGQLRRGIAEGILSEGVIVCEGVSDVAALQVTALVLEGSDKTLMPLEVAGVPIIGTDGIGNLSGMGTFFGDLGVARFALFDHGKRDEVETRRIAECFDLATESAYPSLEVLLSTEVCCDKQWLFLADLSITDPHRGIPAARPDDDDVRRLTRDVLKGLKGSRGADRLLEYCDVGELPGTLVAFLRGVYDRLPSRQKQTGEPKAAAVSEVAIPGGESEAPIRT